jgi:hypothetical protein
MEVVEALEAIGLWAAAGKTVASILRFATVSTVGRNRYPRFARVSMKRGLEAESLNTSRSLLMMVFRLWSKSTKVSAGQSFCLNSSRVTISPARSSSRTSTWKGWSWSRSRTPDLRSSPLAVSTSNTPNRNSRRASSPIARHHNVVLTDGPVPMRCPILSRSLRKGGRQGRGSQKLFSVMMTILAIACLPASAEQLKPETVAAFNHYVELSERQMSSTLFLHIDGLRAADRDAEFTRLKAGEVITDRLQTRDQAQHIPIPGGLIHHWIGTAFIPGVTLAQTLPFLEDYDDQYKFYAPDVQRSKLIKRDGDHFKIFLQLRKTKVVTVILNTEYDVKYTRLDSERATSDSHSTRIAEVENAGKPNESEKPVGNDSGFLWRLNSYWRFQQRDGGVYVQLEAISLTRAIPTGLGWLISPFITSIPKDSLVFTLTRTREALVHKHGGESR